MHARAMDKKFHMQQTNALIFDLLTTMSSSFVVELYNYF